MRFQLKLIFLTLGHCLCANQSLVLLEEQFMTRWFSLDLRSSAESREAGNISGGRPEGAAAAFCTYALHAKDLAPILTLWLALPHARTVSPLLIKDAKVLHTRSLPEQTTGFNSPFLSSTERLRWMLRPRRVVLLKLSVRLPNNTWLTLRGKTELNSEGTDYSSVIHQCPGHLNSNTNEPSSQLSHILLPSQRSGLKPKQGSRLQLTSLKSDNF